MSEQSYKIFEAIVDEYIKTGEPVGSKRICDLLDFQISPASVRNKMSALEQDGYLEQPHTSSGRVPSIKGYRLYVERLMPESRHILAEEDRRVIDSAVAGVCGDTDEMIIESASHALAELTKCAVISKSNISRFSVITKVEVIPAGKRMYVLLLLTSDGGVKNRVCRLSFDLTHEQIAFFAKFAEENLSGINLENLSDEYIEQVGTALGSYMASLSPLLKAVADLSEEMTSSPVRFEGESNLIAFEDLQKREIRQILESKNAFTELLDNAFSDISVLFGGDEKEGTFTVSNSGLIAGNFRKGEKTAGSFGVIGPMRLDYRKLIPYIEYFAEEVTKILNKEDDSE